jgi:glycosyltransferase involved in cell wall biosynthesis
VVRLLRNPALRAALGASGRELARHYSWANVAHRVLSYYERLLDGWEQVAETRARRAALPRSRP